MPLFAYFAVVGSVLVGLLFVAEAQLGPPKPLAVSTNFHGLPQPWKAASVPVLTVRDAPAPNIAATAAAPAPLQAAEQPQNPPKVAQVAKRKTKKVQKIVRGNGNGNIFAQNGNIFAQSAVAPRQGASNVW